MAVGPGVIVLVVEAPAFVGHVALSYKLGEL